MFINGHWLTVVVMNRYQQSIGTREEVLRLEGKRIFRINIFVKFFLKLHYECLYNFFIIIIILFSFQ